MAIYHFSAQVISRSVGRSATAAAAYRAGEKIVDKRTGEIYDYTRKKGVDSSLILAPESAPNWVFNREQLWNEVESVERRKDSQLAREINVALPTELDIAQQLELVRGFANEQFISQGMVADIACHDLDTHNPHAHIMLTMREIDEHGFSSKKNRDWNRKELLEKQREAWANHTNKALDLASVDQNIDHRSLEAQGVERIPQIHLGVAVNAMKKRGIVTSREERYLEIESANRQLRKHEFHLGLIDRLESNYKNHPEIESDTPIQFQTIKPPQIKETANPVIHDTREQPTKSEPANEPQRLEQTITRSQREADYFAERLDRLRSNTENSICSKSERKSERTEYKGEPEKEVTSSEISKPVTHQQYRQVIKIAANFLYRLNSEVWNCEPESRNYDLTTNRKNLLLIEALDGRGEILRYQNGKILTQRLTLKDLEIFQRIDTTLLHQKYIADTAARFLHLTGRSVWNCSHGSRNYNLMINESGSLVIKALDGRGEILRRQQDGKIMAQGLTRKDVERFKKINTGLDQKLEQVKSRQRTRSRQRKSGFER